MQRNILPGAERYTKENKHRRIWHRIVGILGCVVVFCTTYALILPAITQERETWCGHEAHTHEESCYVRTSVVKSLTCTLESLGVHTHSDACYDADGNTICGQSDRIAHIHDSLCYDNAGNLVCQLPEVGQHQHTDACYAPAETEAPVLHEHTDACYILEQGDLACQLEEKEGHTHDALCYTVGTDLTCTLAENHVHGDACYELVQVCELEENEEHTHEELCYESKLACLETEGHVHSDSCYASELICVLPEEEGHSHAEDCYIWNRVLICGMEAGEAEPVPEKEPVLVCTEPVLDVHIHDDSCFETIPDDSLTCTLVEDGTHTHNFLCYGNWVINCGMEEHRHELSCYSNPAADVETAEVWMASFADVELTGAWSEDVLSIAKSQIGYMESVSNYEVSENGTTSGYTRYGAWYGIPYGDWCAMFASFCLHYAGVEGMPLDSVCQNWIVTLSDEEYGLYAAAEDYDPLPGDLIFFDWEGDGLSDHVGLVAEIIEATDTEPAKIKTIEGNSANRVQYVTYAADDEDICGYGIIPENPEFLLVTLEPEEDTVTYYCYQEEHTHSAENGCYDENGNVTCELAEHTHTEACTVVPTYYCYLAEHTHGDDCKDENGDVTCELTEHTHSAACLAVPTYYCGLEAHIHGVSCEDAASCTVEEHAHTIQCLTEQTVEETDTSVGESTDGQGSLAGNLLYHSPYNLKYQESSHELDGFGVVTFVLIPQEDIGEDGGASWKANTVEWTARTDANYIVAYCSDAMTSTSNTGATYTTFTLDTARFTSEEQRRILSGIIAHSYPFITAAEMKAQLTAAYEAGEITEPLVLSAKETEYMAGAQWAIWQTTLLAQSFTNAAGCEFSYAEQCLNPLTDLGMTNDTDINNCVLAIKNWLVQQIEPIELKVETYEYTVTPEDYDLYNLEVTVTLNRAAEFGERAEYALTVGSKSTDVQALEVGTDTFTITLTEMTKEELTKAQVLLTVGGEHMQAYFYDSNNHQDLISGNWEYYSHDLSFEVGVDTIDISVTKRWTNGTEAAPEISVQLYANGESYGEPVKLNEDNSWTYIWADMLAKDALGNEIDYTIQEQLVDGYYSTVEKYGTDAVEMVQLWEKVDTVEPGGQYVLLSSFINEAGLNVSTGALTWSENDSRDSAPTSDLLSWNYVDLSDPAKTAAKAIWTTTAGENGGFYLTNNGDGFNLYGEGPIYLHASNKTEYYFKDGYLCVNSACNVFFMDIFSSGKAYTDDKPNGVTIFIPYKLVTKELPKGDINFVLTNTQINTEVTSLTVTKQWEGRPDGVYPEEAVVSLTRNGRIYGGQVTLSAENDWSYTWKGLPIADNDGNAFTYSVAEISPEGYTGTAALEKLNNSYYVTMTNTWTPDKAQVKLKKVDLATSEFLPGAVFDIYLTTNNTGDLIPGTVDIYGARLEPVTVGEDGTVTLQLAPNETYYLVETKAPDGYNTLEEPIGFTVLKRGSKIMLTLLNGEDWAAVADGTTAVLSVKNEMGYVLPETGGTGTTSYTVTGLCLMMSTVCLMSISDKRRKGGGAS